MSNLDILKLTVIILLLLSCKREGCTDNAANNYDPKAKYDDASCSYSYGCTDTAAINYCASCSKGLYNCNYDGNYVFYINEKHLSDYVAYGVDSVSIYYKDNYIGTLTTNRVYTEYPDCNSPNTITFPTPMENSKKERLNILLVYSDIEVEGYIALESTPFKCTPFYISV